MKETYLGLQHKGFEIKLFLKYNRTPKIRPELGLEVDREWSRMVAEKATQWADAGIVCKYWGELAPLYIDNISVLVRHPSTQIEKYPISAALKKHLIENTKETITKKNVINIVPSSFAKRYFESMAQRRIRIVINPPGITYQKIERKRTYPKKERPIKILFVGRIAPKKGLDFLIKALEEYHRPFHLSIVGDQSDLYKDYSTNIQQLGQKLLSGRISFEQYAESRKAQVMKDSDFVVLPSLYGESFGTTCLEALRYNGLLVASDIFSKTGVVNGKVAFLFRCGDKADLLNRVEELLNRTKKQLEAIRKSAWAWTERFTWHAHTHRICNILRTHVD